MTKAGFHYRILHCSVLLSVNFRYNEPLCEYGDIVTMLVIRLARSGGAKKSPYYKVVVADSRRSRDGKFIEQVGFYNPVARGQEVRLNLNLERIQTRIATGAQPSDRVKHLMKEFQQQATEASAQAA